jgi:hypothetical protein
MRTAVKLPGGLLSRRTSPVDPRAVLVHNSEQLPSGRTAFEDRRTEKIGPGVTVRHGLVGKRGHRPHAFGTQPGDGARLRFSLQQVDEALATFEAEIGEGPRRHDDGGDADREVSENTREGVVGVSGDHLWGILLGQVYGRRGAFEPARVGPYTGQQPTSILRLAEVDRRAVDPDPGPERGKSRSNRRVATGHSAGNVDGESDGPVAPAAP